MSSVLIKAEGAGNDFILGTGDWADRIANDPELTIRLCRRRRGIGADGALAIFKDDAGSLRLVHRNADGSPSAFCANGTRCAARVAVEHLGCGPILAISTGWAEIAAEVTRDHVVLELPPPTTPLRRSLAVGGDRITGWHLAVGVPHLVVPVTGLDGLDLDRVARPLRHHPDLGEDGANVHLVERVGDGSLAIRSLERGVDTEVLCCGSGVVAAALVTMAGTGGRGLTVVPRSGDPLRVEALTEPPMSRCRFTGPARLIAEIEPLADQKR